MTSSIGNIFRVTGPLLRLYSENMIHPFTKRLCGGTCQMRRNMMTSSNGNIFRVTGPLCGEFTGPGGFPTQRPVTRSFDVYFDLRLNKRLCKQSWGWWFETLLCPLWRHSNDKPYKKHIPLQWRHNERNGVSNYRCLDCLVKRLFRHRSLAANSPVTGEFPAQRTSNAIPAVVPCAAM